MTRYTYRAEIAYDGVAFRGFAKQPGHTTVESTILEALRPLMPELPAIQVGGRTDRGVHALAQVISFYGPHRVSCTHLHEAIESARPDALWVQEVRTVSRSFHAQYSAIARKYVYIQPEVEPGRLDADKLDRLVQHLVGTRCFLAFSRDLPPGKTTRRAMTEARARRIQHDGQPAIRFDFTANSFLRSQVRVMVSTALREAENRSSDDTLEKIAERRDRTLTNRPAPPECLYLKRIIY